jgi:hypothetical protein
LLRRKNLGPNLVSEDARKFANPWLQRVFQGRRGRAIAIDL